MLPKDLLEIYAEDNEWPVELDEVKNSKVITADLLASEAVKKSKGDVLKRSLIRHNSFKLAKKLMELV